MFFKQAVWTINITQCPTALIVEYDPGNTKLPE